MVNGGVEVKTQLSAVGCHLESCIVEHAYDGYTQVGFQSVQVHVAKETKQRQAKAT